MQAGGHGSKQRKYEDAIAALLQAPSVTDAARQINVSQTTLLKWMRQADFAEQYQAARKQIVAVAVSRMQRLCSVAVERLEALLNDPETPKSAIVQTARLCFEVVFKGQE